MNAFIILPGLACIALVFIHVYFGSFVLKRGIIFIDIALAQWAALGYVIGHWLGIDHPIFLFLFGFLFTIIASILLSTLKRVYQHINHLEAVIGVLYILAAAFAVTFISSTGLENHHLNSMLSGHLLFINSSELIFAYALYLLVAIILFKCHKQFEEKSSFLWDLSFYILFGLVVTSSVKLVGVLLVFSFLVIPLLSVQLFVNKLFYKIGLAWALGLLSSLFGLFLSLILDIPPSYCIILSLSSIWTLCIVIKSLTVSRLSF